MAKNTKIDNENNIYYFLLPIIFLIPFFISYIFTIDHIYRTNSVSLEEEAEYIKSEDLNYLYIKNSTSSKNVIILGYHQIREYKSTDGPKTKLFITSPKNFEKEIKYLIENNYNIISLKYYLEHLSDPNKNPLKEKSVVITFDDGYISQYNEAFPILKKYNITATFFIYTDCIDKYSACMTSDNIRELYKSNMDIANHTLHHIYIPSYKNVSVKKEILDNEKKLNNILNGGFSLRILAYPFGGSDEKTISLLKDLNYLGAVAVSNRNSSILDRYNLRRYLLGNDYIIFENIIKN